MCTKKIATVIIFFSFLACNNFACFASEIMPVNVTAKQAIDKTQHTFFMRKAISLANEGMNNNKGGPFGAVIVKNGKIIGKGYNMVTSTNDPTAHAEIVAIRDATRNIGSFDLSGAILYTSCEPCPMCLSASYWANIGKIFYGNTKEDAADIGFRDDFIYRELDLPVSQRSKPTVQILRNEAQQTFKNWKTKQDRTDY